MDSDKCCLKLHGIGCETQTSWWKGIADGGVMKAGNKVLTSSDESCVTDHLEDVAKEMKTNLAKMNNDKQIKMFVATEDVSATRNKRQSTRIFGVSALACSDPKELCSQGIFNGNKLLKTKLIMTQAAASTLSIPG
jgi:hypothetical protein